MDYKHPSDYSKLVKLIESNPTIKLAYEMCVNGHESIKQVRKYSNEPYWHHPFRVASLLVNHCDVYTNHAVCAALQHDLAEDVSAQNPNYSLAVIKSKFGPYVNDLVFALTNEYTREKYPDLNREKRNNLEAQRLSHAPVEAMNIKLCDIIDNVGDMPDCEFTKKYAGEKLDVIRMVKNRANPTLVGMALEVCNKRVFI